MHTNRVLYAGCTVIWVVSMVVMKAIEDHLLTFSVTPGRLSWLASIAMTRVLSGGF